MLILGLVLGFVIGALFGVLVMAVMVARSRNEETEGIQLYCKDCVYSEPADEDYCYWCDRKGCEVYGHTEACELFTDC